MAMTNRYNRKHDSFIMYTIEELVPQDHLVRKLEAGIDFRFIYPRVKELYSSIGRPSIDPVVLFKLLFINITFGINSMRRTCEECKVNLAYRWFLGLEIDEEIPNYSTWSQNYIRRYKDSNIFDEIFNCILSQAMMNGFVDMETVFGDGTHQKANANKKKNHKEEVKLVAKKYEEDLLREINEDRECIGLKPIKTLVKTEQIFNEETGEVIEVKNTKNITVSDVDPESGLFHKGDKDKCFAYNQQTFCDKNGFVVMAKTFPGNVHDSTAFLEVHDELNQKYPGMIKNISLDAGYKIPAICRAIIVNGQIPYLPYTRSKSKKGYFKKYEYVYDEYYDVYICPNNKILSYTTTTKDGYRKYKSDKCDCTSCPYKAKCTKLETKDITRHMWESYVEEAEEIRHRDEWENIYPKRKETIERVFADCKEQFGFRFTRLRGLQKNQHNTLIVFACHNLKKMATWGWKHRRKHRKTCFISSEFSNINLIMCGKLTQRKLGVILTPSLSTI